MAEKIAEGWYEVGDRITLTFNYSHNISCITRDPLLEKLCKSLLDMGKIYSKALKVTFLRKVSFILRIHDAVSIAQIREQIKLMP